MDDDRAFERQIGAELRREIGVLPRFDTAAIAGEATMSTPTWCWPVVTRRLGRGLPTPTREGHTMFSALKFVAAGVIVALFGGFLLAGALTTPAGACGSAGRWLRTPVCPHAAPGPRGRCP